MTAVLGATVLLGACGGGGKATVEAGAPPAASATPVAPTTDQGLLAAPVATTLPAATPAVSNVATDPAPTTATVEIHFSTADGWHATATLRRDDGTTTAGVPVTADSPAIFDGVAPGTYAASVDAEGSSYQTSDATLAPPLQFVRGAAFTVNASDHIVVDCDGPAGCVVT